jgi:hypothetical protein
VGRRLPPGEAERRRKLRQWRAFSGDGGPRYDPIRDGYGNPSQWRAAAGEGFTFVADPEPTTRRVDADLTVLGLADMPESLRRLHVAWRFASLAAHPDAPGGSHDAFIAVGQAYERLKRRIT